MKYRLLIILFLSFISLKSNSEIIYEVYPDGAGLNSLQGAITQIQDSAQKEDYVIIFDDGKYYLEEPLIFDSWVSNARSITLRAKEGAHPVICGGRKVTSWETAGDADRVIKAHVDSDVRNLWIDSSRMKRADGYIGYATAIFNKEVAGTELKGLLFPKDGFPAFGDVSGLELVYYLNWRNYYFKVDGLYDTLSIPEIPEDQVLVTIRNFDIALRQNPKVGVGENHPYYFKNAAQLLDEPGEWCHVPSQNEIYYMLREDENIEDLQSVAPCLQSIISIRSSSDLKVSNLAFSGLEFSINNWEHPSAYGYMPTQGSTYFNNEDVSVIMPGAVSVADAKNISFNSCKFTHLGSDGIEILNNADSVVIRDCEFRDISGAAVCVADRYHIAYTDSILPVKNIVIDNNLIQEIGMEYACCPAIEVYFVEDLTISHNELYDCPYTGISVGFEWTMAPNTQKNVRILKNKIIGNTLKCSDGGAIYSLSHFGGDGLLIQGNYIDETVKESLATTEGAIYADQGSSNVRINNNVVLTDRNWFYYHQAGRIDVDTVFVLSENHDKYGGWDIPAGGTEINYCGDGEHIFDYPHERGEIIIRDAGIQRKDPDVSDARDVAACNIDFNIKQHQGGIEITAPYFIETGIFCVRIYGMDGRMERTVFSDFTNSVQIEGLSGGMHIIEISSENQRWIYRVWI